MDGVTGRPSFRQRIRTSRKENVLIGLCLLVGIILLIVFFNGLSTASGTAQTQQPRFSGGVLASAALIGTLPKHVIVVDWPRQLQTQNSDAVNVSLVPSDHLPAFLPSGSTAAPNPPAAHAVIIAMPLPLDVQLDAAAITRTFGPSATASLTATLSGVGLTKEGGGPLALTAGPAGGSWTWTVEPTTIGWHVATVSVTLQGQTGNGTPIGPYLG